MRKTRGFKLGRKLVTVFKWVFRRKSKPAGYLRLDLPSCKSKAISKILDWGRCLKRGAKGLCSCTNLASEYTRFDREALDEKPVTVPKGHLAVYVGQKDGDPHRFLVPVIYFNHPLFAQLLREAEDEYGFHHPGGITIPCQISEFESVQTRIAAGVNCRKSTWKRRL
ncbi:PREDICTED: auxin-responsive protein SAUR36 [Nelumbo nucifera]|uniref:Auxin-responsive protein SAUR36-like n=2 Tax=Nelumbo nucifera TaxID=4432 RepID=A0A822ZYD6_NELNU|nr:PREDICTED: auxin-responsive protein SAUR36 [Nelumbo nucifera]DAD47856.1 TPA_asm: hypothetical protein HUJ06_017793 [Nelumbo nucifera]